MLWSDSFRLTYLLLGIFGNWLVWFDIFWYVVYDSTDITWGPKLGSCFGCCYCDCTYCFGGSGTYFYELYFPFYELFLILLLVLLIFSTIKFVLGELLLLLLLLLVIVYILCSITSGNWIGCILCITFYLSSCWLTAYLDSITIVGYMGCYLFYDYFTSCMIG